LVEKKSEKQAESRKVSQLSAQIRASVLLTTNKNFAVYGIL